MFAKLSKYLIAEKTWIFRSLCGWSYFWRNKQLTACVSSLHTGHSSGHPNCLQKQQCNITSALQRPTKKLEFCATHNCLGATKIAIQRKPLARKKVLNTHAKISEGIFVACQWYAFHAVWKGLLHRWSLIAAGPCSRVRVARVQSLFILTEVVQNVLFVSGYWRCGVLAGSNRFMESAFWCRKWGFTQKLLSATFGRFHLATLSWLAALSPQLTTLS